MRSDRVIKTALDQIDEKIDRAANLDHPLKSVLITFLHGKRAGLVQVREAERGEHWETRDQLKAALRDDLGEADYVQVQSMLNAIEWAVEERDSI